MLRSGVSHTPSFQEAAEMLLQPQLGHSGLSETGLDTTVTAGTAGGTGIRDLGVLGTDP